MTTTRDDRPRPNALTRWRVRRGWSVSWSKSGDGPWRVDPPRRPDRTVGPQNGIWPRWLHRLYASSHGYFWAPCVICGRWFGGHEWGDYGGHESSVSTGGSKGRAICPWCTSAGIGDRFEALGIEVNE